MFNTYLHVFYAYNLPSLVKQIQKSLQHSLLILTNSFTWNNYWQFICQCNSNSYDCH